MSRLLHFSYDIRLDFDKPVKDHNFVLRCMPPTFPGQAVMSETLNLNPFTGFTIQRDGFGNMIQSGFLQEEHDYFRYCVRGAVCVDHTKLVPERAHPMYLFSTKSTAMSEEAKKFLKSIELPEQPQQKAQTLAAAVSCTIKYRPGTTNIDTTAAQALSTGEGVCQDYAHVFLMLARASGIPARYVNGLSVGEGASHAWCEVYLDGVWRGIDPTRNKWTDETYIRFNVGRDFFDCPLERGIFSGITTQSQTVYAVVKEY